MGRPFNIFPKIGYKNSQFQIVSTVDNLKIDIYDKDKIIKSIEVNSKYPTLITSLNSTGNLIAKCTFNNQSFEQDIEIREAYRLGSSEFKKAFVFEETDFSFFLMKDRLLLFDEKKKLLLTENHYSPTEIHKINKSNFLFITKVGSSTTGISNLGIYNTESFSVVGELINDFREIIILLESNKAWLYQISSKTIHCVELTQENNLYFTELKKFDGFIDFFIDSQNQNIFIVYQEVLKILNLNNLHNAIEITKSDNNAIDRFGNVFTFEKNKLNHSKCLTEYSLTVQLTSEINLESESFLHIGNDLKNKIKLSDLNRIANDTKDNLIFKISENDSYYKYLFPESEIISESYTSHQIFPTKNGIFIIQKNTDREFKGIVLKKHQTIWDATPYTIETNIYSLLFISSSKVEVLIDKTANLTISKYHDSMLLVNSQNKKKLFFGNNEFTLENGSSIELFTINGFKYFLIKSNDIYSLYHSINFKEPILEKIIILNPDLIKEHRIIWYRGNEKHVSKKTWLNGFDLKTCSRIFIGEKKVQHSLFKDALDFKFYEGYSLSSNQVVFNPISFEVKDAFIGKIETYSKDLNKIVSHRTDIIYLSVFNTQSRKYELSEVTIENKKYKESYLSPDGQFLVLQEESNKYQYYDIEKNETINFFSGNFLGFRNDGSLIVEEDVRRTAKIIDPKTFHDITPPNYHHYRFTSPDGKLYAQVAYMVKYFNKLNGKELTEKEVRKYKQDLDKQIFLSYEEIVQAKLKVEKNRKTIFLAFKKEFEEMGIEDYNKINSSSVVKVEKYTEIGIVGTNVSTKVYFPDDLWFYNYFAFSFDNEFCAWVGKPEHNSGGYINLIKIDFNQTTKTISVKDSYLSSYPKMATWICGFSRTGYFATYDSTPDTYIINAVENLFENKTPESELRENIYKSKLNFYCSYNNWNIIEGKNFLCFSPSGYFLALSEQGYEPLLLGGYGHQESNLVHIAETRTGKVVDSFTGHGEKIKDDFRKKVTFVAFSEDEKRIMTLSSDGVVIIRDIMINNPK